MEPNLVLIVALDHKVARGKPLRMLGNRKQYPTHEIHVSVHWLSSLERATAIGPVA